MHRRAKPNDGFAMALLELDKKVHGKVSMEWQFQVKVCSLCCEKVGFTTKSLAWHARLPFARKRDQQNGQDEEEKIRG